MALKTECIHCGEPYTLADNQRGKQVRCKVCGETFEARPLGIKEAEAPEPSAAPASTAVQRGREVEEDPPTVAPATRRKAPADEPEERLTNAPATRAPKRPARDEEDERPAPRRGREREREEEDEPAPRRSGGVGLWLALGGLVLILFVCAGGGGLAALLLWRSTPRTQSATAGPGAPAPGPGVPGPGPGAAPPVVAAPHFTNADFDRLHLGMTRAEVERLLGPGRVQSERPLSRGQNTPEHWSTVPVKTLLWTKGADSITASFASNDQLVEAKARVNGASRQIGPVPTPPPSTEGPRPVPTNDKVTKANFDRLMTGMTPDEVIAILGEPASRLAGGQSMVWASGKSTILVRFRNGVLYFKQGRNL